MAKNVLPVDFQDDILTEDMDGRRRYQMITNADGTLSLVDVTEYTQVGSNFGQAQINATNEAVNESADKNKIIDTKADLMANTQAGMIAGALAVKAAVSELTEKSGEYTYSGILGKYYSNYGYCFVPFPNNGETITLKAVKTWDNFTEVTATDFSIDKITKDGFVVKHNSSTYIGNMMDIYFKVSN